MVTEEASEDGRERVALIQFANRVSATRSNWMKADDNTFLGPWGFEELLRLPIANDGFGMWVVESDGNL